MEKIRNYIEENYIGLNHDEEGATKVGNFYCKVKEGASAEELKQLITDNGGEYLFDGVSHSYVEIADLVGDQKYALGLMGLTTALGLTEVMDPKTLNPDVSKSEYDRQIGMGQLSIVKEGSMLMKILREGAKNQGKEGIGGI